MHDVRARAVLSERGGAHLDALRVHADLRRVLELGELRPAVAQLQSPLFFPFRPSVAQLQSPLFFPILVPQQGNRCTQESQPVDRRPPKTQTNRKPTRQRQKDYTKSGTESTIEWAAALTLVHHFRNYMNRIESAQKMRCFAVVRTNHLLLNLNNNFQLHLHFLEKQKTLKKLTRR